MNEDRTNEKERFQKAQGEAFRLARKEAKLTQAQVVEAMGKSVMWLSDLENGKTAIMMYDAHRLCELYNVDFNWLSDTISARM